MVLGPLFIELGIEPEVSTATTGFMLLFTGFAGTTEYLTLGRLPWRYLLWFGSLGAIGAQCGQRIVKRLIARSGRPSIVVVQQPTLPYLAWGRGLFLRGERRESAALSDGHAQATPSLTPVYLPAQCMCQPVCQFTTY